MWTKLGKSAAFASLFGLGFGAAVLALGATKAWASPAKPVQECLGTQDPHKFSCADCVLTFQSGIANGNNCQPCRYGFSWTISCGPFESGGNQSDQIACGTDPDPITVPCPGGSGTAFSFDYACGQCQ